MYLPSLEELKQAFPLEESFPTESKEFPWVNPHFARFQYEQLNYQVYTQEFISSLAGYLLERIGRYQNTVPQLKVLEVGAGDGRLTAHLRNALGSQVSNVEMIATDNKDWETKSLTNKTDQVENIDYKEALSKYQPTILISCWMNVDVNWTADFRDMPSVQEYIMIGDVFRTADHGAGWYLPENSGFKCDKLSRDSSGGRNGVVTGSVGRFDGSPFNPESRTEVFSFKRA
jgi:hypothetical protein